MHHIHQHLLIVNGLATLVILILVGALWLGARRGWWPHA